MNKFLSSVQSFVHSITTNDRYASYESQYRSSSNTRTASSADGLRHEDSSYNPATGLQSAAGGAGGDGFSPVLNNSSTTSVDQLQHHPYGQQQSNSSATNLASSSQTSLNRVQYQPGLRSTQINNGGIPLQDYAEGVPPPPAPGLSWKRVDKWIDHQYPELFDQISWGVTSADLNELESDLDCTLPLDVRDSYMIHDGQESGGHPTGIIFGITLLDLEGISEEWGHWKNTAVRINRARQQQLQQQQQQQQQRTPSAAAQASTSSPPQQQQQGPRRRSAQQPRLNWLDHQESVPDGAIQRVYAHPGWIPLAKDGEGNNIAVDLAPGPRGRWGQVILFGRDFDRKYVIANCWASFLATYADDLETGDHYVFEDVEEGELRFRAPNGRLVSYFDVLRSRVDRQLRQARKQQMSSSGNGKAPAAVAHTQPSPAAASRQKSQPSTRNSSPNATRKVSSPLASGVDADNSLISPVGSSTNLPATGLSTSATVNAEKKTSMESNGSVSSPVEEKAVETASPPPPPVVASEEEPPLAKKKNDENHDDKNNNDDDEVDMLKDDLTEVEI